MTPERMAARLCGWAFRGGVPLLLPAGALLVAMWLQCLFGVWGPGADDFFQRWVYLAVFLLAAASCLVTAVCRPDRRSAAVLLGLGLLSFCAGSLIYSFAPDMDAVPVPSVSDPLWLAIYPFQYAAFIVLSRRRIRAALPATRLDGLVSGLAVASVVASLSVPAAVAATAGASPAERVTSLAYPVGDLVLLGVVVSAVGLEGWRIGRMWATLAGSIVAWVGADLIYLLDVQHLVVIADALVMTGGLGLAVAVVPTPRPVRAPDCGDRGLLAPIGFALLALTLLVAGGLRHLHASALVLAGASLALTLVRMALALRENRALLTATRADALTDALTGLGNRRRLTDDLAAALRGGTGSAPHVLVLLDLNGFKQYNDTHGHGAGDLMLARLGRALVDVVGDRGVAYRMGGDEFCVLAPLPPDPDFAARCAAAMSARGDGYALSAAHGTVTVPAETADPREALALADRRMYVDKNLSRALSGG